MSIPPNDISRRLLSIKNTLVSAQRTETIQFFTTHRSMSHISAQCAYVEKKLTENRIEAEKVLQDIKDVGILVSKSDEKRKGLIKSLTKQHIQDYLNIRHNAEEKIKRIERILTSECKTIIGYIPQEKINDYLKTNDTAQLKVRLGHIFSTKAACINLLDIKGLFSKVADEGLSIWLVEKILASKKSEPIHTLVTMGKLSQYLATPSVEKIKCIISSTNAAAIDLLTQRDWNTLAERKPSYFIPIRAIRMMSENALKRVPLAIARNTYEQHAFSNKKNTRLPEIQKHLGLLKLTYLNEEQKDIPHPPIQETLPLPCKDEASSSSKAPSTLFFHPQEENSPHPQPKTPLIVCLRMSRESYFRYKLSQVRSSDPVSEAPNKRRRLDGSTPPGPQPNPKTMPIGSYNPLANPSHPTPRR